MTQKDVQDRLHERLTALADHQGEACPSYEEIAKELRDFEYKYLLKWLEKAPAVDSPEYAELQEEWVLKAVADRMAVIDLPKRHAAQEIHQGNAKWNAAFKKISNRLTQSPDTMLALLGSRGTGKTQMAIELIRFMVRHEVEAAVNSPQNLERWAWFGGRVHQGKGLAHYSTTTDFFLQLKATYKQDAKEREDDVLGRFAAVDLLILDEVHDRRESDWENSMFTYLIDRRYQSASKQTIFIANQTPQIFEASVGASIADRILECGGVMDCNWSSFRDGTRKQKNRISK